jgi:hypothetical protein
MLCLDDCFTTTIMPQPAEITQFIFGQPLSVAQANYLNLRRSGPFKPELPVLKTIADHRPQSAQPSFPRKEGCKPIPHIAKPFEPRELLARVRTVLRRAAGALVQGPRVCVGRRVLGLERRVLIDPADDSEERLAASEFDLSKIFAENSNRPLMRELLLEVTTHPKPRRSVARSICASPGCAARSRSTPPIPKRSVPFVASATCSSCRNIAIEN